MVNHTLRNRRLCMLRAIGGTTIYTASDNLIAKKIAENVIDNQDLNYVRLDRHPTENIDFETNKFNFEDGFRIFGRYAKNKNVIISHGRILSSCVASIKENHEEFYLVDLFRSKPISKKLVELLNSTKKIVVVDEQTQYGNLSSAVQSELSKYDLYPIIATFLCLTSMFFKMVVGIICLQNII